MTCAALRRCRTSRYEDGSSIMYTCASWAATTAMANRCSSPPERFSTLRSHTCAKSRSTSSCALIPRWSLVSSTSLTLPRTALGMWSTYWGLMMALMLSSRTRVK
mmetsp:Transcript_5538/g.9621  ORF Transcript_5538/g.9621 Transcript_5538/m.9621 type:complete len:105 (-) Transcript_5538:569-883(-)